jgi:dCMP deaminase
MVYYNEYKDNEGIAFLEKAGVSIQHIPDLDIE